MTRNPGKSTMSVIVMIVLMGWASRAEAGKPPKNVSHACQVTVSHRPGDSILSDALGVYTEGVDAQVRLWDMMNGVADHLYFQASGNGRSLKLWIPGVTNGVETCGSGTLQPNLNSSGYQFYNLLPIGSSTADVGQNFGGTYKCASGTSSWNVTYESECIVIAHTGAGQWSVTADGAPCTATVTRVENRRVVATWVGVDVPFQVNATELP
jgi:hypothetical protein